MFRLVNQRSNQLIEVKAQVLFVRFVEENGRLIRRFEPLELERNRVSFFPLSWTIVHPITEESPLFGLTKEDLQEMDAEFLVLLTGIDETFAQTVHTRSSYKPEEIHWDRKFTDLYVRDENQKQLAIDIRKLSKTEKVE